MTTASEETAERLIASRYRLQDPIGRGGMGVVWLAEDTLLRRSVAVKELRFPTSVTDEEQATLRERSLREARAAARLDSPHVVRIYDVVDEDGRPCIVMELLRGRTLSQIVREQGPLPPGEVARIGTAVADALQVAHAEGIVHRDVKPGNVFLGDNGRVVLTDFGIATSAGDSSLTETGLLVGSPAYMAPERARGGEPTPASDLWSLGATLYTAVEGHAAFDAGDPVGTLTSVVTDPPRPLRRGTGPLAEIIHELLAKDPAARPSAALISRELTAFAARNDDALTTTAPMPAVRNAPPKAAATSTHGERTTAVRVVDGEVRPANPAPRGPGMIAREAALPADGYPAGAESTSSVGLPVVGGLPGADGADGDGAAGSAAFDGLDDDAPIDRRGRRRMIVALLAVAVVVAAAVTVAFTGLPGSSDRAGSRTGTGGATHRPGAVVGAPPAKGHSGSPAPSASGSGTSSGSGSGSASSSGSGSGSSSETGSSSGAGSTTGSGVPAGWQTYTSPEGWTVAHGPHWSVRTHTVHGQPVTDMLSPAGELLRVNVTPTPFEQPIDDWRSYEPTFAKQVSDYQRIDMRPLTVDGNPAADWEFTYSSGGVSLHALDREVRAGDTVYAVLFQTHSDAWDAAARDRDAVLGSFQPGG